MPIQLVGIPAPLLLGDRAHVSLRCAWTIGVHINRRMRVSFHHVRFLGPEHDQIAHFPCRAWTPTVKSLGAEKVANLEAEWRRSKFDRSTKKGSFKSTSHFGVGKELGQKLERFHSRFSQSRLAIEVSAIEGVS